MFSPVLNKLIELNGEMKNSEYKKQFEETTENQTPDACRYHHNQRTKKVKCLHHYISSRRT